MAKKDILAAYANTTILANEMQQAQPEDKSTSSGLLTRSAKPATMMGGSNMAEPAYRAAKYFDTLRKKRNEINGIA